MAPGLCRFVDVAVDAAGPRGGQTFTYHVPQDWEPVLPGTAVVVEYGRRPCVGVVLSEASPPEMETKPLIERIHADGPILAPLQARLARHIGTYYLAPPALAVRGMLPAGMLERVELIARAMPVPSSALGEPGGGIAADWLLAAILEKGGVGVAVTDLIGESSRAATLRLLRGLERDGAIRLDWRLGPVGGQPRRERVALLTAEGAGAARALRDGEPSAGQPLGPRQKDALLDIAQRSKSPATDSVSGGVAIPAAELAGRHGPGAVTGLARRGLLTLETRVRQRRPPESLGAAARGASARGALPAGAVLGADQARIVERVAALIAARRHVGILVQGTAASGKTAVYAAAVAVALAAGRGAIVLVPEIALAVPLLDRLRHDLGVEPALFHSGLSDGERADEWRRVRSGETSVVIGTRICVLAPVADPGVIVVDEEHDAAYKSDRTPRFQARDLALVLGEMAGAPVLLGSATPDIVSLGRVELGRLESVSLSERAAGAGTDVELVDLRQELFEGNRGLLSSRLVAALRSLDREAGDRAVLVINRRGSASVVLCRDCGYVQVCPECQRPLVFHAHAMALRCHHCGAAAPVARRCPACSSARIRYLGGGTERVERELRVRFPDLRVGRLDRDVVERRGAAVRVVDDFADGRLDVLVGTSLVTKGLDVPQVTLVGVVSADIALNLPDERAAERTYQLLTQAVGRAGRGPRRGRGIIQTYLPDHPAIAAVASGDPRAFVAQELSDRRQFGSPPFGSVIKLTVGLEDRAAAEAEALRFGSQLRERAADLSAPGKPPPAAVLGPVPAYVPRRNGRWRFHLALRGSSPMAVLRADPGSPWSVDVDPDSLL